MSERTAETSASISSTLMRRKCSDSIYLWACGETADDEDDEPTLSDQLIGWLILFMQGFAYTMLIVLARATSDHASDISAGNRQEAKYLLPSVTGAMYLLIASTSHDLGAGYSLLVDGSCAVHRAFGIGLLTVYAVMISAAMTVIVSTSDDSASVVLNAVTVLFVADLDEKTFKFLATVPQKWRLFWTIQSIAISFALALVAILYIGRVSPLLEGNTVVLETWPTGFIWVLNPAAVTLASVLLSSTVHSVCEFFSEEYSSLDEPTVWLTVARTVVRLTAIIKRLKSKFRKEPCFYATLTVWFAQVVPGWVFFTGVRGFPVAFDVVRDADGTVDESATAGDVDEGMEITSNKLVLLYSNLILATGLAAKAWGVFKRRHGIDTVLPEQRRSVGGGEVNDLGGTCAASRLPSLLVGWGAGFWATSSTYVLACSWHGGGCGWNDAPVVVTVIAYIVLPCFLFTGVLMLADTNFLGARFGSLVKPVVDRITDRGRVEYWVMATVLRDFMVLWMGSCQHLRYDLSSYE